MQSINLLKRNLKTNDSYTPKVCENIHIPIIKKYIPLPTLKKKLKRPKQYQKKNANTQTKQAHCDMCILQK